MLNLAAVRHRYGEHAAVAVDRLELRGGDQALLLGPSGCGKTTVLHIAAGLLKPSQGSVRLGDTELTQLRGAALDHFRGRNIGIVFQRLHLIPSLTVLQNLMAAQYYAGLPRDADHARHTLEALGIADKAADKPQALSQGQAQRAAIARAVVNRPQLILADEPTSSLDDASAERVLTLLIEQARTCKAVLLVATHDARAKSAIARHVTLEAGR